MGNDRFVYVIYIRSTRERVWDALIKPEFTRQYWAGTWQDSDWRVGSDWKIMVPDGRVADTGKVLEFDPPKRLSVSWQNHLSSEMEEEGHSRATFELDSQGSMVKVTVTHEIDRPDSKLIKAVSGGWPAILSSLKSLLETGESLEETRRWPKEK
jgi:uncharacterized protein YndB with AHSA1/START domain